MSEHRIGRGTNDYQSIKWKSIKADCDGCDVNRLFCSCTIPQLSDRLVDYFFTYHWMTDNAQKAKGEGRDSASANASGLACGKRKCERGGVL